MMYIYGNGTMHMDGMAHMKMMRSQQTCVRGQTYSFSNNGRSALIGSRILMQLYVERRKKIEKKGNSSTVGG